MKERRFAPCNLGKNTICLGKQGEANHLRIEFDCSGWLAEFPDGVVALYHFPAGKKSADKPHLETVGTDRVWTVSAEDTVYAGDGVIELVLEDVDTGAVLKSATGYTNVIYSPSAAQPVIDDGDGGNDNEGGAGTPGEDGGYYKPSVSSSGVLSWQPSKSGMPSVPSSNIKGPAGKDGNDGAPGATGPAGKDGRDGEAGPQGPAGKDGFSPVITVTNITGGHRVTITDANGTKSFDVLNGTGGSGEGSGAPGQDGFSPIISVIKIEGGHRVTITDATGTSEFDVMDGSAEDVIDDTTPSTEKTYSSSKVDELLNAQKEANATQDAAIEALKQASGITPKMSNIIKAGTIFEKPDGLVYCGWPFNNIQYDPDINSIVFLINAAVKHGDNGNTHLYMGVMSLDTYDVTIKEIGNPTTLGHGFYTMGFCINNKGEYLYVDAQSATLGKSVDKGVTWTETDISAYSTWPESLTQLSNGRYLMWDDDSTKGVWYSDNDCATWTQATMPGAKFEGDFLELPDGVVMCFMRTSSQATDNGSWSGNPIREAISISISHDYGATWSAATASATILDGSANVATAFYHEKEDLVEVFTSPRYPYGDTQGAIFQYIATREDALNDKFSEPKVVQYATTATRQDFGHIGGCFDNLGDMHMMYYDGEASGEVNYHYLKASRNQATLPVTKDDEPSVFLPCSGAKVNRIYVELMKRISDLESYVEKVSCTGITIDPTKLTFTATGSQTITATVTPVNTSDVVEWVSADENVATVDNGVVTAVSDGSTTVTATCGAYSATCVITVTGVNGGEDDGGDGDDEDDTGSENLEYVILRNTAVTLKNNIGYIQGGKSDRLGCVAPATSGSATLYEYSTDAPSEYAAVKIPEGATKITLSCPGMYGGAAMWKVVDNTFKRLVDVGWSTAGGWTYTISNSEVTHFTIAFKKTDGSAFGDDYDLSGIVITCS